MDISPILCYGKSIQQCVLHMAVVILTCHTHYLMLLMVTLVGGYQHWKEIK